MTKMEKNLERLAAINAAQAALKSEADLIKMEILAEMKKSGQKKLAADGISVTYIAATTKMSFDSSAFKVAHPKLFKEFQKVSPVSEYLKVSAKA